LIVSAIAEGTMTALHRPLAGLAALFALSACAGAEASLDRMAAQVDARSNCHTSTGEWAGGPSCAVSYSLSSTTSTTTVVTTTTTAAPASPETPPPADD
jgi:hypothetical protein